MKRISPIPRRDQSRGPQPGPRHGPQPGEEGYILIAVLVLMALFIIALAVAVPAMKKAIQRDREVETMHRGKQYARAVKLYYRKFGRFPPNIDALVNTNQIRFLRKKYVDPTTGKEEWKAIAVGQQKTQSTGFFGQPIAGSAAGTGLSGSPGMAGTLGGANPSGGLFSGSGSGTGQNSIGGIGTATPSPGQPAGTNDPSNGGSTTDANGNPINGAGTGSGTGTSQTNPTLGGIGIMGFSPNSPKQSILVWRKKNHYNEWEFIYDPAADMTMQGGNAGAIGQPAGSTPIGTGPGVGPVPGAPLGTPNGSAGPGAGPTSPTPQQ